MKVKPIATMIMKDVNELDPKIVAISLNSLDLSHVNSLDDLKKDYIGLLKS